MTTSAKLAASGSARKVNQSAAPPPLALQAFAPGLHAKTLAALEAAPGDPGHGVALGGGLAAPALMVCCPRRPSAFAVTDLAGKPVTLESSKGK